MEDPPNPAPHEPLSYVGMRSPSRIGRALRSARRDAGMTQAELAVAASVSREAVSMLENGQRGARTETLNVILFALGYELAFVPMAPGTRRAAARAGLVRVGGDRHPRAVQPGRSAGQVRPAPGRPTVERPLR